MCYTFIGVRDGGSGQGGAWKTMEIRANASKNKQNLARFITEYRLNSGNFITILKKNSGKLSTAPWKASAPYAYV
jgi:hypothetical protein